MAELSGFLTRNRVPSIELCVAPRLLRVRYLHQQASVKQILWLELSGTCAHSEFLLVDFDPDSFRRSVLLLASVRRPVAEHQSKYICYPRPINTAKPWFEYVMGAIIMVNAVVIGLEYSVVELPFSCSDGSRTAEQLTFLVLDADATSSDRLATW